MSVGWRAVHESDGWMLQDETSGNKLLKITGQELFLIVEMKEKYFVLTRKKIPHIPDKYARDMVHTVNIKTKSMARISIQLNGQVRFELPPKFCLCIYCTDYYDVHTVRPNFSIRLVV